MSALNLNGHNPKTGSQYAARPKFKLPSDFDWIVDRRSGVGKVEMAVVYTEHSTRDFMPAFASYEVVGPRTAELFEIPTTLQINIDKLWGGGTICLVNAPDFPAGFSRVVEVNPTKLPDSILCSVYTSPAKANAILLTWIESINK